jgi:ferric-dicitrate binding protein FerR (iron transport regulator)
MEQNFTLFENYKQGTLTQTELSAFERRLADDPKFKSEYDEYLNLIRSVRADALSAKMKMLRELEGNISSEASRSRARSYRLRYLSIAAGFLLIAVIGYQFLFDTGTDINEYFTPYPELRSTRGETDENISRATAADCIHYGGTV